MLLGDEDGGVRVLRPGRDALWLLAAHHSAVTAAAASADGRWAVTVSREGDARIWSASLGFVNSALVEMDEQPVAVCFHGPTGFLFLGTDTHIHCVRPRLQGLEVLLDTAMEPLELAEITSLAGARHPAGSTDTETVTALCGGPEPDPSVFVAGRRGLCKLVVEQGSVRHRYVRYGPGTATVTALAVDDEGRHLAAVDNDGLLTVWDADELGHLARHRLNGALNGCAWGRDGNLLLSGARGLAHLRLSDLSRKGTADQRILREG
jgi:WD40 repeat protein